jgi:hypothetical protein
MIAVIEEIYTLYHRFANKYRQFAGPSVDSVTCPEPIRKVLDMCEEMTRIHKRKIVTAAQAFSAAAEKDRADKEAAREEARHKKVSKAIF